MRDFSNYYKALKYAFINYGDLKRKSNAIPYIIHPIRMTSILRAAGFTEFEDKDIMIAALFHDLLEDTDTSIKEIANKYNISTGRVNQILKYMKKRIRFRLRKLGIDNYFKGNNFFIEEFLKDKE